MEDNSLKDKTLNTELEALINAALNSEPSEVDRFTQQVQNFIASKRIVEGDIRVPLFRIYQTYKKTVDYPLSKILFNKIFKRIFKERTYLRCIYYCLTLEPFDLPYDYTLTADLKKRWKRHGKKGKAKKQQSSQK